MAALQRRIQLLEKDLEKSEKSLKIATEELDIVCQEFDNKDDNRFDVILFDFEWGSDQSFDRVFEWHIYDNGIESA